MAVTAANVRSLEGAILRDFDAGGSGSLGNAIYIASDDDVEQTDANLAVSSAGRGVVVAVHKAGQSTFAAGDRVTVCLFGPVAGFSSLTPNTRQYVGETAGAIVETAPSGAGTWTWAIGYAERADVLFVMPGLAAPSSNS